MPGNIKGFAVVALLVVGVVLAMARQGQRGSVFEEFVVPGGPVQVRVRAFHEKGFLMPVAGAYYVYEHRANENGSWNEIASFRADDALPIPKNQVRRIGDTAVCFFVGWIYGVTSDGGKTWSVWDAEKDLPGWKPADYRFIKDVHLALDGKGTMSVNPLRFEHSTLLTSNFGQTWSVR